MNYYFNELDSISFQRLINAILLPRFGEHLRLTPLRGADGGRDAETAPKNPYFEATLEEIPPSPQGLFAPLKKGRYLFQVKHHRTVDTSSSEARATVLSDFETEMQTNVLSRMGDEKVNYFFLITNVPSSKDALFKLDEKRKRLLRFRKDLHVDIWWQEQIIAHLDRMPSIWNSFPELFAGKRPPFLGSFYHSSPERLSRAMHMSLSREYSRESKIKFRQIDLERDLSKLFVNLDVAIGYLSVSHVEGFSVEEGLKLEGTEPTFYEEYNALGRKYQRRRYSAIAVLLNESGKLPNKIILEGGPGQGKSTITQMVVQIYRELILNKNDIDPENRWTPPQKIRIPFRIELRTFAEWVIKNEESSVEQYLASTIKNNSGGTDINVNDIHTIVETSPLLLIFDGLDEVGSDDLRDKVISKINECINRFETELKSDVRVILTTRPPAMVGRSEKLTDFRRLPILPMHPDRISSYVERWLSIQVQDKDDSERVRLSFERRKKEPHVQALIKNPMQLSVLLHFIRLKGEAFPDRRAELYREYFQIVIDRDVEKSHELLKHRELIEALHQFLGYKIHVLTEAQQADGTLNRSQLLEMVEEWLKLRGNEPGMAAKLFKIGEERLGLIVTLKGEGEEGNYGYEIQPVREYFAAAFINNQIRGNAHDVFNEMVRRAFWKEVALFLAGLRRPNEKADLIARAKQLDNDPNLGWRQDGRAITGQLLAEGVYSDPKHVFTEGINYVLEIINPQIVPIHVEIKEATLLSNLLPQDTSNRANNYLKEMIDEYHDSRNEYIISQLYKISFEVFDENTINEMILGCKIKSPELLAKVRLSIPLQSNFDVSKVILHHSYWVGVDNNEWAQQWWITALTNDLALGLPAPSLFHQLLLEMYASLPFPTIIYRVPFIYETPPTYNQGYSHWAVWQLLGYQRLCISLMISFSGTLKNSDNTKAWREALDNINSCPLSTEGLDKMTSQVVIDLIDLSRNTVNNLLISRKDALKTLAEYSNTIREYLKLPGFLSWLTCRCVGILFSSSVSDASSADFEEALYNDSELYDSPQIRATLVTLWKDIKKFYFPATNNARSDWSRCVDEIPDKIWLEGQLIPWTDILVRHILHNENLPFDWVKNASYTSAAIRPLVDACRTNMHQLILWFRKSKRVYSHIGQPLLIQDVQKILKIARNTDDPDLLIGSLKALETSKFIRIAKVDLVLKMIRSDKDNESGIDYIFRSNLRSNNVEETQSDIATREVIKEISRKIVYAPQEYSFQIRNSAASYFLEHCPIKLPPLLSLEKSLEIEVGK